MMDNQYSVDGTTTTIFLKYKGKECCAFVDTEDLGKLLGLDCTWCANKIGNTMYAVRNKREHGKSKIILMHRFIYGLSAGDTKLVDHIDGNGLNNRKENLRIASRSQNGQNVSKARSATGIKNVYLDKGHRNYYVRLELNGKMINGGTYESLHDAAQKASEMRRRYFEYSKEAACDA